MDFKEERENESCVVLYDSCAGKQDVFIEHRKYGIERQSDGVNLKMHDDISKIKKIFPDYFMKYNIPPKEAREESILSYRACKSGKCDKASFTPTFEERGFQYLQNDDPYDPGLYSLSVFENPKHVKRFATLNSELHPPYPIAVGRTNPAYGLVQRTKERKSRTKSHIDWWLYIDATPHEAFEIIPDFEEYLNSLSIERI